MSELNPEGGAVPLERIVGRDPRTDPRAGDEIRQPNTGAHLRVTAVHDGKVTWQRSTKNGWEFDNSWSLRGWASVVAKGATVLRMTPNSNSSAESAG